MRIRRFAALGALAATLATVACSPPPTTPTTTRERVDLPSECPDGAPTVAPKSVRALNRSSRLIAPANYQPGVKYPLLVSLHPFVLDGEAWENYSGLGAAASTRGYWVLVPTGSQPGPRWAVPGGLDTKIDDIAWIEALIQSTAHTVCVDGGRVFAAGFSAGAAMSVGLSCELPWRFTAIAASGGSNLTSLCPDSDPVDALILHGSADGWAPVTGSEQVFATPMGLHVDRVVETFAHRNGCASAPTVVTLTSTTTADRYTSDGHRLEYRRMRGAGHTWAGASFPLDPITGPTDRTFSATTEVLDFFDQ